MSMYEFTHQLDRLNNRVELYTASGHQTSPLMRPFDVDKSYIEWSASKEWDAPYNSKLPHRPLRRGDC